MIRKLEVMYKKFLSKLSLVLIFTGLFIGVTLINLGVAALVAKILINTGDLKETFYLNPSVVMMFLTIVGIIVGVATTTICTAIIFMPIREMLASMKKLAGGDFSVRYKLSGSMQPYELVEFSEEFNKMAQELGSIEMLRSDFVNNFSHEFKTPIVSLRGFAKILKEGNITPEEQEEYLDIIIHESDRLAVLATNVLNLSKIENQAIISENTNFNLSEQIRTTLLMIESKWSEKELDLDVEFEEIYYNGNAELLSQVWVNVLDNAVKFSEHGGKIQIKLMDLYDSVVIKIRDYGSGMDEETKTHIFDKFYQGDTSHTAQGNGIGMTVVKKIITLHKGQISVESSLGQGTLITILLPKENNESKEIIIKSKKMK